MSRCRRRCKKSSQVAFEYGSGDAMCKGWVYMNFECCGGARKSEEKVVGFRPPSYPLNIGTVLSRADERPAPTTINPSQYVRDIHWPLPFAIRFASAPVAEAVLCRQGTTAEYGDSPW